MSCMPSICETLERARPIARWPHRVRCPGHSLRQPAHPVPRRPGLPVQGESAFQGLGARHRQPALHPGLPRPGTRPQLLFHQPNDFWHKPASLPTAPWTRGRRRHRDARPREGLVRTGRSSAGSPSSARRAAFGAPPAPRVNNADLLSRLHYDRAVKTGYEIECLRRASALGVRGHRAALRGVSRRRLRVRGPHALSARPARSARRRCRTTTSSRTTNTRRSCTTSISSAAPPRRAALVSHRCRRAIPRLRSGHHAHLCRRARACSPISSSHRPRPVRAVRRDRRGTRLSRCAPHRRTGSWATCCTASA